MVIGITGGIGSGKTVILNLLGDKYGFVILEADKIAKELMEKGTAVFGKIAECFGNEILDERGCIDRQKFAAIVFNDKEKLTKLNALVHPSVIEEIDRRIKMMRADVRENFVIEAALLIESGCHRLCDKVWYIYTEKNIRIERLKAGRKMTEKQIADVIKNQLEVTDFERMADAVIDNSFSIDNTDKQIQKLLEF